MRKKEIIRRGLAIALASVLILSEGMPAFAMESMTVSGGDISDGDFRDSGENPAETSTGEAVEENTAEMFPGMAEGYTFNEEEIAEKAEVQEYAEDWRACEENSYVSGELIFLADTKEEALLYAEAYNATLTEYSYGVAVITLNASDEFAEATVMNAMEAAADPNSNLPAVWPNYYQYLDTENLDGMAHASVAEVIVNPSTEGDSDPFLSTDSQYCQWFHYAVNSHIAHKGGITGKGIKVAVIDTGINTSHEEFSNALTIDIGCGVEDDNNHGSNVCGIIGAMANNGKGGCGIAPDCTLMSIRVFQNNSATEANVVRGINAAVENDANIINMSLGGSNYSDVYQQAIDNAYQEGVVIFCSAGNNYADSIHYPGGYNHAVSVAALNQNLTRAAFSNYGKTVRYAAPGVQMWAPYKFYNGVSSSTIYGSMQGTSQASPVMAGCAALLYAYVDGSGSQKVENVLAALDKSCTKLPGVGVEKGIVNMAKALGMTEDTAAPPKPVFNRTAGTYNTKQLSISITAEPGTLIYYSVDGKPVTYRNGKLSDNAILYENESFLIGGKGTITVNAIAVKQSNQLSSANASARYILKPSVEEVTVTSKNGVNYVAQGRTLALQASLYPDYAADKKVTWSITNCPDGKVSISNSGVVKVNADAEPKSYLVNATSSNGKTGIFTIKVLKSYNPVTSVNLKNRKVSVLAGKSLNIKDITVMHQDKTGGKLSDLQWSSSDNTVAVVSVTDSSDPSKGAGTLTINTIKAGKIKVTGTAKDGNGKSLTIEVNVTERVYGLKISGSHTVAAGRYINLTTTTEQKPTDGRLEWSVSPAGKGVSVANGRVTAKPDALRMTYTITAKARDGSGATAKYDVTVVNSAATRLKVKTTSVKLDRLGSNAEKLIPVDCDSDCWDVKSSNPDMLTAEKYISSEESYVRINATGKAIGKVSVTVYTTDGSNKKVTLKADVRNPVGKLMIAPETGHSNYIAKGTRVKMSAKFITDSGQIDNNQKKIIWSSSDKSIMVVDSGGYVTCRASSGSATITATTADGSKKATYYFTAVDQIKDMAARYTENGRLYTLNKETVLEPNKIADYEIYILEGDAVHTASQSRFTAKCSGSGIEAGIRASNGKIYLRVQTKDTGTYKVTVACNDGSKASVNYTFYVSDNIN